MVSVQRRKAMPRKGENIYRRKDGRWEARYIHHYENGKAKYRYVYGATYMEAKQKRIEVQTTPQWEKIAADKRHATFEKLTEHWLKDIKVTVKESTYTRYYRIVYNYLIPRLKNQSLAKIDLEFLKGLTEELLLEGSTQKEPLAPKTVSDIVCVLKSILQYGKNNGYPSPDFTVLRHPQKSLKPARVLTEDSRLKLEKILLNAEDTTSLGILFALFTGVRIGELCGLRWEDVDFNSFTVSIKRTVERIADLDPNTSAKTKVVLSEPKTENSIRTIPLPGFLAEYLECRRREPQFYLLTGKRKYTEPHQFYVRYRNYLEEHGIENYTFHSLRHTFATRCVEMEFDTKSLAEILGHSHISTTLSIYVHPSLQQKKLQMDRLVPGRLEE
jgi:integrase